MKLHQLLAGLGFVLTVSIPALAAEGHKHDAPPPHGGQYVEVGAVGLELVAKADSLTLYLNENDKPTPSAGAKATATITSGSSKTTASFEPAGENRMVAKGDFKVGVGVRVAVTATLPGKGETKANFRLK